MTTSSRPILRSQKGTCILEGNCEWDDMTYPNCHRAAECKARFDWENSPEKAESDRRDAEAMERYKKSGNLDDIPF
jgi:hypothetical protein